MSSTPETTNDQYKELGFEPTQIEIDLYQKNKLIMYKGVFFICLIYGICAAVLLFIIFYTDWGKEYLYKKMLPACITFVLGAVFIIIYLSFSVYDLKPIKNRTAIDEDNQIICPDFWNLIRVTDVNLKTDMVNNNNDNTNKISDILNNRDSRLNYKCVLDQNVYGTLDKHSSMKNNLYTNKGSFYQKGRKNNNNSTLPDYLYVENKDTTATDQTNKQTYNDVNLKKYAQFTGIYNDNSTNSSSDTAANYQQISNNNTIKSIDTTAFNNNKYKNQSPLICNEVYPQILANWDKETPEQNKYRCAYAKACDIPWTAIGCEYKYPV